jgi:hypothetical protein
MSAFYKELATNAGALLAEYGQQMSLIRTIGGTIDPVTGQTTGITVTLPVIGIVSAMPEALVNGTSVLGTDMQITIDNQEQPAPDDVVQVGATRYKVMRVNAVAPAGYPVIYKLQARL